ncbi:MAG TPA: hypothetical protein DDW52_13900 [Planctomycetaceae bacterium]|nr:hypothetical protein [Planctomycetaceae bacterium]
MDSLIGRALVASPFLNDPNFLRSVVYILEHNEEGAIGLILNRPTDRTIRDLLGDVAGIDVDDDSLIFWGGPVDGPLMLMQEIRKGDKTGIFAASDQAKILELFRQRGHGTDSIEAAAANLRGNFRLFDGYAGWSAGQLDAELSDGGWLIWEIESDQIFGDPSEIWQTAIKAIGRDVLTVGIDPTKLPDDPAYN